MKFRIDSCFAVALLWFISLARVSAETIGYANTDQLFELYKLNPENINLISEDLTTLIRWVTTTRPLALPGRMSPQSYKGVPLTFAMKLIYIQVEDLVEDLKDPNNLWTNDTNLAEYGFDQQTIMAYAMNAPEFFEDQIGVLENYMQDIVAILRWGVEVSPTFYSTRGQVTETMGVWDVIYDMVVYITTSVPGGIKIHKPGNLLSYLMRCQKTGTGLPTQPQSFSFKIEDVFAYEMGLDAVASAIDIFLNNRDWDGIDKSYADVKREFNTETEFWAVLERKHQYLRKFIHDYMMLLWGLRLKISQLRKDIHTWAQVFGVKWVDTDNPNVGNPNTEDTNMAMLLETI